LLWPHRDSSFGYPEFVIDIQAACCGPVAFRASLFKP
jgi:hypothetical protein